MTDNWEHPASLGALAERMGMELLELVPGRCVIRMPVAGNTQPLGLMHGGASGVLIETAGSFAAHRHGGPHKAVVGVELNVTHHRAVTSGWVTVVATALHEGRTTASYQGEVTDEAGRRVATGRLLCMIITPEPGSDVGRPGRDG